MIENRPHVHRGAGMTFARIQELIGELELGETKILIVLTLWRDINYIKHEIYRALDRIGIKAIYNTERQMLQGPPHMPFMIKFCTDNCIDRRSRGWNCIQIPMGHYD